MAMVSRYYRMGRKGMKGATPTRALASVVAARIHRVENVLPALRGITEIPVMRPDGSILASPGYDPVTLLYYAPPAGFELPEIPQNPGPVDPEGAIQRLTEPLADFPFDGEPSKANTIAMIMTAIVREMFSIVPMFIVDAPTAGTGKGKLADIPAVMLTGRSAPKLPE